VRTSTTRAKSGVAMVGKPKAMAPLTNAATSTDRVPTTIVTGERRRSARRVPRVYVVVEELEKVGDDRVALEGQAERAVDEDRRLGLLEGAGQGDADIGVLRLA